MDYQKLFNHMSEEHGLILLQTEMDAIISVVNEIQTEALSQSCVGGMFYCNNQIKGIVNKCRVQCRDCVVREEAMR